MHTEFTEPEEMTGKTEEGQATVIPPDEDMLTSEAKIVREHASTSTTGATVPEFTPPPFTGQVEEEKPEGPPNPAEHPLANPGVKDAPPHVKEQGVEFVADKILLGYGKLKKTLGGWLVLISERKLDKMEEAGQIDRNVVLPVRGGGSITAGAFIDRHNDEAEKVIDEYSLTKSYYDTAKPMLVEELAKRDIALNNLQMLGVTTAMDLFEFGEQLKPLYLQRHEMIGVFKEATQAYKQAGPGFTPAYAQQTSQQAAGQETVSSPQSTVGSQQQAPPQQTEPVYTEQMAPFDNADVNSAFDQMQQHGDRGFMQPNTNINLPTEFSEMEKAAPKAPRAPRRRSNKKRSGSKKHKPGNTGTLMNTIGK